MNQIVGDRIAAKLGRDAWAYRESRARGETVKLAMHRVRTERTCRDVLSRASSLPDHVAYEAYNGPVDIYEVDVAALYRHTNGASPNVTMADGSPVDGTVDLVTDEASAWIVLYYDESGRSHMDEDECYDEADRESWRNDEWVFVGVQAIVSLPDGRIGTSAIWGVEQGAYWPGSDESQIWHVVPDQLSEALDDAKRQKVPPSARGLQWLNDLADECGVDLLAIERFARIGLAVADGDTFGMACASFTNHDEVREQAQAAARKLYHPEED